jgi:hypothetical protein
MLRRFAAYVAAQSMEMLCLGVCKAMVLSRLIAHASLPLHQSLFPPWHSDPVVLCRLGRFLIVVAFVCGVVGVIANGIAASSAIKSSRLWATYAAGGSQDKCAPCLRINAAFCPLCHYVTATFSPA